MGKEVRLFNYPNGKSKKQELVTNIHQNSSKGMNFEAEISNANEYYYTNNVANIHKKPTPIKVLKVVNYKDGVYKKSKITEAVFDKKSTTDYNGVYKGFYIDFEAKETINKTFNIKSNLHQHQIDHLLSVRQHGGISFLLVNMKYYNEVYVINIDKVINYTKTLLSIEYLREHGYEVNTNQSLHLDYLKCIDTLIEREHNDTKKENKKRRQI